MVMRTNQSRGNMIQEREGMAAGSRLHERESEGVGLGRDNLPVTLTGKVECMIQVDVG